MIDTTKHALSDDWRTGPSLNQPIDLTNALRSIRKVIAAIDTRDCDVNFNSGKDESFFGVREDNLNQELIIRIDPTFALKSAPIQGHDFDVLTGLSVHEALHSTCKSDEVRHDGTEIYKTIVTMGEEIYIDNYGKRNFPVLGKYIHLAREGYKPDEASIAWDNINTTWPAISIYGIMPPTSWLTETSKMAQLQLLMELSSLLIKQDHVPKAREKLYQETASRLEKMIEREEINAKLHKNKSKEPMLELEAPQGLVEIKPPNKGEGEDKSEGKGDDKNEDSDEEEEASGANTNDLGQEKREGESVEGKEEDKDEEDKLEEKDDMGEENGEEDSKDLTNTDPEPVDISSLLHPSSIIDTNLANSINEVLRLGIEDMSEEVSKTFGVSGDTSIIWQRATTPIDTEFNQELAKQLVWVKDYKNTRGHQTYRNEARGRLDSQRIFKAPINGLIFKKRVELPRNELDLVMLLDASSSMNGNTNIYDDAKALHQTLPETVILSYDDNRGINLVEHTEGRVFHQVIPRGGTPTAKAIAATAIRFPKSLIIHFTDGECDRGELEELFPKIHTEFPKLKIVHIQLKQEQRYGIPSEGIPEFEGMSKTVMMDSIYDFPEKLKEILRNW